ncbi:CshA/CshB family fibrillar adhesin-related protein [Alcanivorax sp.]|uniref:CshA/CshB family fibrillar adhesin-related protein n=1 Tax=Alcanivorax sp. TaxID=1872427 RepID=UPI000C0F0A9D|nr:CshA/CshB family fibrillar adhesin-related protein [Alcanivorax sp.]PHR64112.1 MAG: hypothetical protein COA55_14660 [Alcanivorax sp.]
MMMPFRLSRWIHRIIALALPVVCTLTSASAVAAVQRGFVNLSFEAPQISTGSPCRASIGHDLIPGWITDHPLDNQNVSCPPGYSGPAYSGNARLIEMWRGPRELSSGQGNIAARNGQQFAELNAEALSKLTQDICLIQGEQVAWRFSHNGRNSSPDSMVFSVGSQDVIRARTSRTGSGNVQNCYSGTCNPVQSQQMTTGGRTRWADYSGTFTYSAPTGDTVVGFESAGGSSTNGNFLDDIQLVLKPVIEFQSQQYQSTEGAGTATNMNVVVIGTVPAGGLTLNFEVNPASTAVLGTDYWIDGGTNSSFSIPVPAGEYEEYLVEIPITVRAENGQIDADKWFEIDLAESPGDYNLVSSSACGAAGNALSRFTVLDAPVFSGHIFEDDGSGVGATAGNGLKEGSEAGFDAVGVRILGKDGGGQCDAGTVLAQTQTDANGAWQIQLSGEYVGDSVCLETDAPSWGYESTSESLGSAPSGQVTLGSASDDRMEFTVPEGGGEWADMNFGDERLPNMCHPQSMSMQLGGHASRNGSNGEITLTPEAGSRRGYAWSESQISLLSDFTLEFNVYLGTRNGDGADGIVFAFQDDPAGNAAVGEFGGALGVGGLSPAVAVEFDTWNNGSNFNDIGNDHTMIYNPAGYGENSADGHQYSPTYDLGNIEDGNWHSVQLTWTASTNTLAYSFDGNPVTTTAVDFVNDAFGGDPNVYFGFTAATGGSYNEQKVCITDAPPQVQSDYGDAPSSFGEPSHILGSSLVLGTNVDAETAGYNDVNAAADNFDDGVTLPPALPSSLPIEVEVQGDGGYLQAWVDWNGNGTFDDPQERIATDLQDDDNDGIISVVADYSGAVASGDTYARFRWSSQPGLDATEGAVDGEVEDYRLTARSVVMCETGSESTGGGIASGGNGPYRDAVYWLDWNCLGKATFDPSEIVMKSWVFGPVEIRATISDITAPIEPYNTGNWGGDLLDDLYSGVNPIGLGNADGNNPEFRIDWQVYLDGNPIPAEIIIADAEDTDDNESMYAQTNGDPWELFAVAPGTDDLQVRFENGASRMVISSVPGDGVGSFLAMTQGVTTTQHVIDTNGGQAMAFGVFVQKDHGDIVAGYPESGGHFASQVAQGGGKPTADTDITTISLATLEAPRPYLGLIPPGPEEMDQNSVEADADGAEEDGVSFSALVPGSLATLDIIVTENTPGQGYLQGWIDWNRNNVLDDSGEQVALNVQDNGPQDSNPAVGEIRLGIFVPLGAFVGDTYARFRFSNTSDVPAAGMLVIGGEVEDYKVNVAAAATAGLLSGWVFEDNGIGAIAHDGIKGSDEPGLADVPVTLYHDVDNNDECSESDPVLASTMTEGDGAWLLVAALADVGKPACLHVGTPSGLLSVSENSGSAGVGINLGAANDDVMTLSIPPSGTDWEGILFGDAGLPILEPDQQGVIAAGGSRFYSHRFTARSAGEVDFALGAAATSPVVPAWSDTLYRDDNCNAELDGADATLPLTAVSVTAGEQLCLLVKVFAPGDAPVGALHQRPLLATQAYTGTAFQASAQVVDTTRIAAGELELEKRVQNLTTASSEGTSNQASPGDVLRYRLIFRNQGSSALTDVVISDSTPAFTSLNGAVSCPVLPLPTDLTGCAITTPDGANAGGYQGALEWTFTGELQPGAEGVVSYDVKVDE